MTKHKVIKKESIINPGHTIYACYENKKRVDTYYVPWEAELWLAKKEINKKISAKEFFGRPFKNNEEFLGWIEKKIS